MSFFADQAYLRSEQYKDASNLNARVQLHRRFSTNPYGWTPWVFDQFRLPSRAALLDVGCGPSHLWADNGPRLPVGWQIHLVDFSPGMLDQARANLAPLARDFHFVVADLQALPFADARFDAVIANHMLYHVPDRPRALSEIRRALKPGGRLYAATNGRDHMRELRELVAAVDPAADVGNAADVFGLENGAAQLAPYFETVSLHRYEDGLVVSEVEPLLAYILSTSRYARFQADSGELARLLEDRMADQGAIPITKEGGMFEAVKSATDHRPDRF